MLFNGNAVFHRNLTLRVDPDEFSRRLERESIIAELERRIRILRRQLIALCLGLAAVSIICSVLLAWWIWHQSGTCTALAFDVVSSRAAGIRGSPLTRLHCVDRRSSHKWVRLEGTAKRCCERNS